MAVGLEVCEEHESVISFVKERYADKCPACVIQESLDDMTAENEKLEGQVDEAEARAADLEEKLAESEAAA